MSNEKALWSGTPSQLVNLPLYVLWVLLFWLVIPLFIMLLGLGHVRQSHNHSS